MEPTRVAWHWPPKPLAMAAGAVAVVVGLAYWFRPIAKHSAGWFLFSRFERPQVTKRPQRAALLAVIEANPGIPCRELVRRVGLAQGTAAHHVRNFVDLGLVVEQAGLGYTRYFAKGALPRERMAAEPWTKFTRARAVLAATKERSGYTVVDVAGRLVTLQATGPPPRPAPPTRGRAPGSTGRAAGSKGIDGTQRRARE